MDPNHSKMAIQALPKLPKSTLKRYLLFRSRVTTCPGLISRTKGHPSDLLRTLSQRGNKGDLRWAMRLSPWLSKYRRCGFALNERTFVCVCVCVCVCTHLETGWIFEQGAQAHCGYLCQRSYSTMGEAQPDQLCVPAIQFFETVDKLLHCVVSQRISMNFRCTSVDLPSNFRWTFVELPLNSRRTSDSQSTISDRFSGIFQVNFHVSLIHLQLQVHDLYFDDLQVELQVGLRKTMLS